MKKFYTNVELYFIESVKGDERGGDDFIVIMDCRGTNKETPHQVKIKMSYYDLRDLNMKVTALIVKRRQFQFQAYKSLKESTR